MLIETETTPNPATLKFLPGRPVMNSGTRDFASPEEAEASPLAEALFNLGDVEGVFFGRDFISVTAAPGVSWPRLKPDVFSLLLDHFAANMPLFKPATASFSVPAEDAAIAELREFARDNETIEIAPSIEAGDEVTVLDGPFKGLRAVVTRVLPAKERVAVLLELLGTQREVEVTAQRVVPGKVHPLSGRALG